jgi:hypothetical protein
VRTRGLASLVAAILGIVVTAIDAADDGFSVWNAISIICFAVVFIYGVLYFTGRLAAPAQFRTRR